MRSTALTLALLSTLLVAGVNAHGSLTSPASRNVISPILGQTWWKDHGNGHGGTQATAGPKPAWGPGTCLCCKRLQRLLVVCARTVNHLLRCSHQGWVHCGCASTHTYAGICGDPYQHYGDTSYYSRMRTTSQATFTAGQTISVQWNLQVRARRLLAQPCALGCECVYCCHPSPLTTSIASCVHLPKCCSRGRRAVPDILCTNGCCCVLGGPRSTTEAALVSSCATATPTSTRHASTPTP